MGTLIVVLKWISQAMIVVVGVWGLFSDPFKLDSQSGRRTLTNAGWMKVLLLLLGFVIFGISSISEQQSELRKMQAQEEEIARQKQTIDNQERQLRYLRSVLLSQHELSQLEITLTFSPGVMKRFRERIHSYTMERRRERLNESLLAYLETSFRLGTATIEFGEEPLQSKIEYALVRPQGYIAGTLSHADLESAAFQSAYRELFGNAFEIQSLDGRIMLDLLRPGHGSRMRFEQNSLELRISNPGLRMDEMEGRMTVICGRNQDLFRVEMDFDEEIDGEEIRTSMRRNCGPDRIHFRSLDPRVAWDQEIELSFEPVINPKLQEYFGPDVEEYLERGTWRSQGHEIQAELRDIEPE